MTTNGITPRQFELLVELIQRHQEYLHRLLVWSEAQREGNRATYPDRRTCWQEIGADGAGFTRRTAQALVDIRIAQWEEGSFVSLADLTKRE